MNSGGRVLAVDVTSRGFGFVVVEGVNELLDWGTVRGTTDQEFMRGFARKCRQFEPDVIVIEDVLKNPLRSERARRLTTKMKEYGKEVKARVETLSLQSVRRTFSVSRRATKDDIARMVAEQFPALKSRLPRLRKPWMSEDLRMSIFDAGALAISFLVRRRTRADRGRA